MTLAHGLPAHDCREERDPGTMAGMRLLGPQWRRLVAAEVERVAPVALESIAQLCMFPDLKVHRLVTPQDSPTPASSVAAVAPLGWMPPVAANSWDPHVK